MPLNTTHASGAAHAHRDPAMTPSDWVVRWAPCIAPKSKVLDLACGAGRHTAYLTAQGHAVLAVDVSPVALSMVQTHTPTAAVLLADLEGEVWPLQGQAFDAIVVTNYLWRDRLKDLMACLAPNGVLIYETFAQGNETVGKPSRPDFLLRPGELLQVCADLEVVAYEAGFLFNPPRFVQRIAAVRLAKMSALSDPESPRRFYL